MSAPLPFAWPYCLPFWAVYFWVFIPEFRIVRRARSAPAPAEDRGSLRVVLGAFNIGITAAFVIPFVARTATLPGNRLVWFYIGILFLITGSMLRRHCFRVLGTFFSGVVEVQQDHRVVDTGAYRWLRHPSYSAALLIVLGISLALDNWLSMLVALALTFPAYAYRAHVEERALLASLGPPYAAFVATRKRFIPFIY